MALLVEGEGGGGVEGESAERIESSGGRSQGAVVAADLPTSPYRSEVQLWDF